MWRALASVLTGGLAVGLGGCVTPASPVASSAAAPEPEALAPAASDVATGALNGEYTATLMTRFAGPVEVRFTAESLGDGRSFKANTRPGVAWAFMGGLERTFGPLLSAFVFPRGMILHWTSTTPTAQTPGEGWIGLTTFGPLRARTFMAAPGAPVEIRQRDGKPFAYFTITPGAAGPTTDYPALVEQMGATIASELYDPAAPATPEFQDLLTDIRGVAGDAQDDLEFLFGTVMSWRRREGLTLPLMFRAFDEAQFRPPYAKPENQLKPLAVEGPTAELSAAVTANLLERVDDVDAALREARSAAGAGGLIIDLQNAAGLDLAALRVASWVIDKPIDGGVYFGRAWRERLASADSRAAALAGMPVVELRESSDYERARRMLAEQGAARLVIHPVREDALATARVGIVISRRTSASAETLAAVLAHARAGGLLGDGRVRFFGEATTRRVMLGEDRPLSQGWVTRVARYDWSLDGAPTRREQTGPGKGVVPDESGNREASLKRARTFAK